MPSALELFGLTKRFIAGAGRCYASADVLRSLDFTVDQGEAVAVIGNAASGKSTLLLCAAGLLKPDAGVIRWFGQDARATGAMRATYHYADTRGGPARRSVPIGPHIHLIDGPEALPPEDAERLARWVVRHRARGDAIVVATRELSLAHRLADRTVLLVAGRAQHGATRRAARVAEASSRLVSGGGIM